MYHVQLDGSLQTYKVKDYKLYLRANPRGNVVLLYQKRGCSSAQLGVNVGNTLPSIYMLNYSAYSLSTYTVKEGNLYLCTSTLINPFVSYTFMWQKVMLLSRLNYLYILSPIVCNHRVKENRLIMSYINGRVWYKIDFFAGVLW